MAHISEAVRKTLEERASKKKTESKAPTSGGMKKDVQVKTYTRKTKSGKTVTVKAHTAKRKAGKPETSKGASRNFFNEEGEEVQYKKAEKMFDEYYGLALETLDVLTEGTLKYKKGKDPFNSLVNAFTALATPKKKGSMGLTLRALFGTY